MKISKLILLFIFLTQLACGQTKNENSIYYIVVGVFCGECSGHCATMYKYNLVDKPNMVLIDTTDSYFRQNGNLVFNKVVYDKEKVDIARKIVGHIPTQLLATTKLTESFGCPDCTDGCGIYFEFRQGGKTKTFQLDYQTNQLKGDIKEFAEYLKITIGQLYNVKN